MIKKTTIQENFEYLPVLLGRLSPYVITEVKKDKIAKLFKNLLPKIEPYVLLDNIESPKMLFEFLKQHKDELIIITDDIFSKRKNHTDIVEGAVCSSPDSSMLWPVRYRQEKNFTFKGKLILCTNKTKEEIENNTKFKNFKRDCIFI